MDFEKTLIKKINNLLNSSQTRVAGLTILNDHLSACSEENLLEFCINWMQNCCKPEENFKGTNLAIETLSLLFKISGNYPQLNKQVSFFISNRFFDHFFKYFKDSSFGWNCMKNCFLHYRGPCGPFQEMIEKHLLFKIKQINKISQDVSDCIALLPSLGGGGNENVNYKVNWINQFVKYIHINHSILNDLFVDIEEIKNYDTAGHTYISVQENPTFDYLVIQLYNYSSVLCSMLLNSYPTPKSISTDLIMEMIYRGLSINTTVFAKSQTTSLLSLKKVLPEIFLIFFKILNSLLTVCGNQLLPYSAIICKFIKQTLQWTQSEVNSGEFKQVTNLRIFVYNTICNWLVVTKSSSNIYSIGNEIIQHIISDIDFKIAITFLKETKSKEKQVSSETKHKVYSNLNACLCYSALRALQCMLKFFGVLLPSEDHKCIQKCIIKLLISIYKNNPNGAQVPYNSSKCRKYLFSILLELILQPSAKFFPPTQYAFSLFKKGENDPNLEVSQFCSFNLSALTVLIHQQYSNGPFAFNEVTNGTIDGNINSRLSNRMTKEIEVSKTTLEEVEKPTPLMQEPMRIQENEPSSAIKEMENQITEDHSYLRGADFEENKKSENNSLPNLKLTSGNIDVSSATKSAEETQNNLSKILDTSCKIQDKAAIIESSKLLTLDETISENHERSNLLDFEGEPVQKKCRVSENLESDEIILKENEENYLSKEQTTNKNTNDKVSKGKEVIKKNNSFSCDNHSLSIDNNSDKEEEFSTCKTLINIKNVKQTSDESFSEKSNTPDLPEEVNHLDSQKRYFLRSKTVFSEEMEEALKRADSLDSLRQTPTKNLGKNNSMVASRRPKTRASSKLQNSNNKENNTPKKNKDEDEILEIFNDSTMD